jgi:transposase
MRPRLEKERALAESLFVVEGKPGRQIAALLGAGKETVQLWAREGNWMERRRLRREDSPLANLERLQRERTRLIAALGGDKPETAHTAPDTISAVHKLTQTIEKMESRRQENDVEATGY